MKNRFNTVFEQQFSITQDILFHSEQDMKVRFLKTHYPFYSRIYLLS